MNELKDAKGFRESKFKKAETTLVVPQGRQLPQALDLEQAILGALMLEKDALAKVIEVLKGELFYKPAHTEIYNAILSLFQNSEPVDLLTVMHKLRQANKLEMVGGAYYLAELTGKVASAANIEYHSHILAQKYIQRELIRVCGELTRDAYEDTKDVFDLLDIAEQELYQLSGNNLRKESLSMEQLSFKTIKYLEELKSKGSDVTGVRTGFKKLDEMTAGWQPSDLIIIAARPSMGKTAFVLSLARNAAILDNKPVALFSLEMAATQLVQRMLCSEAELDAQRVRTGRLEDYEWKQLNTRINQLSKAPIYIDDTPGLSIYDLRAKCRRLKSEKKIEMIIIDYLQLMSGGGNNRGGSREQEIALISRSLKHLAKELNVPVIALSQLSRATETRGGDKRPMLSDLRESGSIEQDADVVIFLYRAEYYGLATDEDGESTQNVAEIIIGKQRNGPVDKVKLRFINKYAKFADIEGEYTSYSSGSTGFTSTPSVSTPEGKTTKTVSSKMNEINDDDVSDIPF